MVPTKITRPQITLAGRRSITTRSQNANILISNDRAKRKANSPAKGMTLKRSALGDVTNAQKTKLHVDGKKKTMVTSIQVAKKVTVHTKLLPTVKTVVKPKKENLDPPAEPKKKIVTRQSLRNVAPVQTNVAKPKDDKPNVQIEHKVKTRLSNEFDKSDESLYTSALENLCDSTKSIRSTASVKPLKSPVKTVKSPAKTETTPVKPSKFNLNIGNHNVPNGVTDFDKENWNDVYQVSHYAMDIFNYLKSREALFVIKPYMEKQVCLNTWMRSLLVDWMIEVQESFELNHETLYLGVKLVDYYLSKVIVGKETLQLVGAASMFIASKYDERIPPLIDDFLYICDGAYTRRELIRMEMSILKICNFDLGIPLSYRFLRRYARCAKVSMPILTLARFILEHALMDYAIVTLSDSKLAAAALYLAVRMKKLSGWTETLEYYTGYKLDQIFSIAQVLNNGLHQKPKEQLSTVRNKYSHKIFYEVAKTPLIELDSMESNIQ